MAVIRIDDELYKKINKLTKGERRFDFPSTKSFVDKAIYEKIKEIEKSEKIQKIEETKIKKNKKGLKLNIK
jgi:hypothetical protein